MKYKIILSKRFEKDMKRCQKRGYNMQLIKEAIMLLAETGHCLQNTSHICCMATAGGSGSATYSQTGSSFGRSATWSFFSSC